MLPERAGAVAHGLIVVLLALGLAVALDWLRRTLPEHRSSFEAAFVRPGSHDARPATLARIEREVTLATGTAFDVHYRLRPVLRPIAAGLVARHGVDLDRMPERAAKLVGPETWELVRPDRPAPVDRMAAGLPVAEVDRVVAELERLACS